MPWWDIWVFTNKINFKIWIQSLHLKIEWLFILFFICHGLITGQIQHGWWFFSDFLKTFRTKKKPQLLEHYICWHKLIPLTRYWVVTQVVDLIRTYWWLLMRKFLFYICFIPPLFNWFNFRNKKIWGSSIFQLFPRALDTGLLALNDDSVTGPGPGSPVHDSQAARASSVQREMSHIPKRRWRKTPGKEVLKEHPFPNLFLCFTSTVIYTEFLSRKEEGMHC